jgi:hypothetical protein
MKQEEVYPQVVLNRVSYDPDYDLDADASQDYEDRIIVAAIAATKGESEAIGVLIQDSLDGYRGLVDSVLCRVFFEGAADEYSPPEDGGGQGLYLWSGNFLVTPV